MRRHALLVATLLASQFACVTATVANDSGSRPPDDTQLAFVRDDQIYVVNPDGTDLIQLTNSGAGEANRDPAWSRDGQRLAFARRGIASGVFETWDIHVMNADGSNVVRLTNGGYNIEPAWGPDDRVIAFSNLLSGSMGVSVIDVDADLHQESRVLLDLPGWDAQPAWSPDGQTITFTSDYRAYDFLFDLGAMNADGSDVRPLLEGPFFWDRGLTFYFQSAWSPDGQRIGVVVCRYSFDNCYPDSAIAVVNADGSNLRVITQSGSYARPTWSPDGRWIAYASASCRSCPSSVRFVQVEDGTEGLIVDDGHSPAWRPRAGARIDVVHSGAWFNPATSGQGQFLDIEPVAQFVFLGWFTYTDAASDNPGQQHWFTAEGAYSGNKAELILYESVGGRFDDPQVVTTTPVGDVTLTFSGCGQGTMSYRFDDRDLEGSFPMMRVISDSRELCDAQAASTTQVFEVNHRLDGAWFDPDKPGQGFFVDVQAGEDGGRVIFVSWFTYGDDTASGQRWLTAEGQFEGSGSDLSIYDTQGGGFDDPHPVESVRAGKMRIEFGDCNHALLSYSLDAEDVAGVIALSRLLTGGKAPCEEFFALD